MKRLLLFLAASASMFGATTTITQTVNLSNGNPANGTALIRISVACTSGSVYIGQQTVAATFLSGAFSVNLTPNDTCVPAGTSYVVSWLLCGASSGATTAKPCPNGATQSWSEVWVIPTSTNPVTVSAVLVSVAPAIVSAAPLNVTYSQGGSLAGDVSGSTLRTVVSGIQGRPVTATVPVDGQMYRWNASAGQWLLVAFADQETVSGTIDGTNTAFTLVNSPNPVGGLILFRNGLAQMAGQDYTLSGNTISFVTAATPQPGDTLLAWYRY
jgi:hypothetical protein